MDSNKNTKKKRKKVDTKTWKKSKYVEKKNLTSL